MRKLYRPVIRGTNWVLAGILSLLGFSTSSCEKEIVIEYGAPHANYILKGKVTNEAGHAIPDIRIDIQEEHYYNYYESSYQDRATIQSNAEGKFEHKVHSSFVQGRYKLILTDTDGEKNGLYQKDSLQVRFEKEDRIEKGSRWFEGTFEKEISITMKEEKSDE
ncbi:MAG: radical SAM-associated putative lipoprotein [Tannerellaceae bacterium]|nr:radical SAM-associated putative lipoprotein [Tannerellaceae bacterium]